MYSIFKDTPDRKITQANINFYANPTVHPERTMNEHDFIYLIDGNWKIGQEDNEYHLIPDTLLILNANHRHYGIAPCEKNTKTMYFHVSCHDDYLDNAPLNGISVQNFTDASINSNIKKYFSQIVNNYLKGNTRKANIFFQLLICELSEENTARLTNDTPMRIKDIIHNNPEKFFSNKELAKRCNLSVKTIETRFKKAFNTSIHQYTLEFKINEAISYLKNFPEMSIKEIAYNLGFYDEYHFSKQFKKFTGTSPSEYKKKKGFYEVPPI